VKTLSAATGLVIALMGCSAMNSEGETNSSALKCATPTDASPELGSTFNVRYGESATIAGEGLELTFAEFVGDSRCPRSVECIAAGYAAIVVLAERPPSAAVSLPLNTSTLPSSRKTYSGYEVQLVDVLPYPEVARMSEATDYCARLKVVRAATDRVSLLVPQRLDGIEP
jgi:hypothetical protein